MAVMNLRQYAGHRGCTLRAVQKAIRDGRLSKSVRKSGNKYEIDPALADEEWARNTDTNFNRNNLEPQPDHGPGSRKVPPFQESRAIREAYEARIKRLEYEQKSGKLIGREEIRNEFFTLARMVRNAILAVPQKVSMELASEIDPHRIESMLEAELRLALEDLSRTKL